MLLKAPAMSLASREGLGCGRFGLLGFVRAWVVGWSRASRASTAALFSIAPNWVFDRAPHLMLALARRLAKIFSKIFPMLDRREIGR